MLETTFLLCAAIGAVVLLFQVVMIFTGGDDGGDLDLGDADASVDADGDHDHGFWVLEVFTLRTLSAAALFFGLAGMTASTAGLSPTTSIVIASGAGAAALYGVYWLFKQTFRLLQSSGNEDIRNALGTSARVYVSIPPAESGAGKVHVVVQGRTAEYQAVTDQSETLAAGDAVEIVQIINSDTVRVVRQA
jgi:membrane protein implicated in regulation of membrane protease activity